MNVPVLTAAGALGGVVVGLIGLWLQRRAFSESHEITEQDHTVGLMRSNLQLYDRMVEFRTQLDDCRERLRHARDSCCE